MGLEDKLEFVNFPTEDDSSTGQYKILQLFLDEHPIMLFGDPKTQHVDILRAFLTERNIPFETYSNGVPKEGSKEKAYHLVGSGFVAVYVNQKIFRLPDQSSRYYDGPNSEHSEIFKRRMLNDGWTLHPD